MHLRVAALFAGSSVKSACDPKVFLLVELLA